MKVKNVLEALAYTTVIEVREDVLGGLKFQGESRHCPSDLYERDVFQLIPSEYADECMLLITLYQ